MTNTTRPVLDLMAETIGAIQSIEKLRTMGISGNDILADNSSVRMGIQRLIAEWAAQPAAPTPATLDNPRD